LDWSLEEISGQDPKRSIADTVLRSLPDWFGIEDAIREYVAAAQYMPMWAAYVAGRPVGFLSLRQHNVYTFEVYCMGIQAEFHRRGIGAALVRAGEQHAAVHGAWFLTVKTLDESNPDPSYAKKRKFYLAMGFRPLEVFPLLWGKDNPCLFLAKHLVDRSAVRGRPPGLASLDEGDR